MRKKEALAANGGLTEETHYLVQKRKEELKHAEEVRMIYEEKLSRINNLYADLTASTLQFQERERELRRREKLVEKILGKPLPSAPDRLSRKKLFLEFVKTTGAELLKPHAERVSGEKRSSKKSKSATLPMDYAIWTAESSECHTDDPVDVDDDDAAEIYVVGVGAGRESVQFGKRGSSKEFQRPPLLQMRSKSADSSDPVSQLKNDETTGRLSKLSPDLCR